MLEEELGTLSGILLEATRNKGRRLQIFLFSDVHYLLSTTAEELNDCFYQSYFLIICGSVWSTTSTISSTAYNLIATEDYYEAALQFMYLVFWSSIIFVTVMPCSSAVNNSKKFNYELSLHIIQGYHSMELHSGDREKLQLHVDFDFTVCFSCGFFQLDRTLIYSIIGNVSSFAVILVQVAIIQ
ncbi:hypothetical protein GE061_005558 [Apolygus lucorum]|uniref:Gustatory receptor n=1 Tax=Apolygus lucorum TaxID=248454 RepID=A0A8S9WYE4_APOLU|nr:hypothetical protein GE061_005558 [Apolygus lucorum]